MAFTAEPWNWSLRWLSRLVSHLLSKVNSFFLNIPKWPFLSTWFFTAFRAWVGIHRPLTWPLTIHWSSMQLISISKLALYSGQQQMSYLKWTSFYCRPLRHLLRHRVRQHSVLFLNTWFIRSPIASIDGLPTRLRLLCDGRAQPGPMSHGRARTQCSAGLRSGDRGSWATAWVSQNHWRAAGYSLSEWDAMRNTGDLGVTIFEWPLKAVVLVLPIDSSKM